MQTLSRHVHINMRFGFAQKHFRVGSLHVDNGSIKRTAAMVSVILEGSKPPFRLQHLQNLTFRNLHKIVFRIMEQTGFAIDQVNIEDKDVKGMLKAGGGRAWAWLLKISDATAEALQIRIHLDPKKVTAGKECAKTRQFLQYFCVAAEGHLKAHWLALDLVFSRTRKLTPALAHGLTNTHAPTHTPTHFPHIISIKRKVCCDVDVYTL